MTTAVQTESSSLASLSATDALARMAGGQCSAVDYAGALLARVDAVEDEVQAWAHLDRAYLTAQARRADESHAAGQSPGALAGLPVGLKDIIDTAGLPTEDGTVLHAGRRPREDAQLVQRLRAAGGVVMGKTVTTELATYAPGKTRNPHNVAHTPGGSSSGSAAAVAAGMVAVAVGTQTNGSVIRPASFCGVIGFKPSAGLIGRTGVLTQSPAFDSIGVFGRTLDDVALLAEVLAGYDAKDALTQLMATPRLLDAVRSEAPFPPSLAWVSTPFWDRVAPDAQAAFAELIDLLGDRIAPLDLPPSAADAVQWHKTVMEAEIAGSFSEEYARGRERLSASLVAQIERGQAVTAVAHRAALARVPMLHEGFEAVFEHHDALVTPAALGTAPAGLDATGDPLMCTLWTFLGLPCISLPLLHGENGLPIGVQLVGRRGDDARLLRTARWLVQRTQEATA